jgi:phage baseplate assembly protein W
MRRDNIGAGWSFPPRLNSRGAVALSYGERDIDEAIRIILSTAKGERPMRPEFGSDLHKLVFAPNGARTASTISYYCIEALDRWEPRIDVISVTPEASPEREGTMLVHIRYRVKATNDERNLVFPFYRIPPEE